MENRGQGGIPWTDDITAPTARTRFASVQEHFPSLRPWIREKQSAPSTPSANSADVADHNAHTSNEAHDRVANPVSNDNPGAAAEAPLRENTAT